MISIRKKTPASSSLSVAFIRHGATSANADRESEDIVRSWEPIPLSAEGIEEAHQAAADLSSFHPDILFFSDLKRSSQSASIIANTLHIQSYPNPLLRTWNMGDLTGQKTSSVEPMIKNLVCQAPNHPIPEGESFNQFCSRLARGIRSVLRNSRGKRPAILFHHRCERFIAATEKLGWPSNLSVDISTFLARGEEPGSVTIRDVPLSWIGMENSK